MRPITLVFVHGYSVTNIDTYGELPLRLKEEGSARGLEIKTEHIFLGRYISFQDDVKLHDISKALETAIRQQITPTGNPNSRFVCITHSTGGPVVRNWWDIYYKKSMNLCPMSHLIMLAPANFGSALAQLGKGKLSRLKSWFDGVEPGQGVLNWLELGSNEAWELNLDWIRSAGTQISDQGIFPFVVTGQDIDRKLYDHLNSYTGELGSDGVVRCAAANLNARYIKLVQPTPTMQGKTLVSNDFEIEAFQEAPRTAMRIVAGKSHSGKDMGIMKSVKRLPDANSAETVEVILNCIAVQSTQNYLDLIQKFELETDEVQKNTLVENTKGLFHRTFIHDHYSMIIFKVKDSEGYPLTNFDLILTAGENNDPNALPTGFFADRQCNQVNKSTITYFFNYDVMHEAPAITDDQGVIIRPAKPGIDKLGLLINPRPEQGFIRYIPCKINASKELFETALKPNSTTLIEIVLHRVVSTEVFRFEPLEENKAPSMNFSKTKPGHEMID